MRLVVGVNNMAGEMWQGLGRGIIGAGNALGGAIAQRKTEEEKERARQLGLIGDLKINQQTKALEDEKSAREKMEKTKRDYNRFKSMGDFERAEAQYSEPRALRPGETSRIGTEAEISEEEYIRRERMGGLVSGTEGETIDQLKAMQRVSPRFGDVPEFQKRLGATQNIYNIEKEQEDRGMKKDLAGFDQSMKLANFEQRQDIANMQKRQQEISLKQKEKELDAINEQSDLDDTEKKFKRMSSIDDRIKKDATIKKFIQINDYKNTLNQLWKIGDRDVNPEKIGAIDNALIKLSTLMLEPGLAVREDDVKAIVGGQAPLDRFIGDIEKVKTGGAGFSNDYRDSLVETANKIHGVLLDGYKENLNKYVNLSNKYSVDIEDVFTKTQLGFLNKPVDDKKFLAQQAIDDPNASEKVKLQARKILNGGM